MKKVTRYLNAMIALAVAVGAPLTPARALVPAAWGRFNEINEMIIKTSWEKTKEERLGRPRARECLQHAKEAVCVHLGYRCKWETGGLFHKGEGYCYPAK
jgi:hypothetical protein